MPLTIFDSYVRCTIYDELLGWFFFGNFAIPCHKSMRLRIYRETFFKHVCNHIITRMSAFIWTLKADATQPGLLLCDSLLWLSNWWKSPQCNPCRMLPIKARSESSDGVTPGVVAANASFDKLSTPLLTRCVIWASVRPLPAALVLNEAVLSKSEAITEKWRFNKWCSLKKRNVDPLIFQHDFLQV